MKSYLIALATILFCTGLMAQDKEPRKWSLEVAYNPIITGTYSESSDGIMGEIYPVSGRVGIQYNSSPSIVYSASFGLNYIRRFIGVSFDSDFYQAKKHSRYLSASLGVKYVTKMNRYGLRPFVGVSLSPTQFRSNLTDVPDTIGDWLEDPYQNLLFVDLEAGFLYQLSSRFDFTFSYLVSHNVISHPESVMMYQLQTGVRYKF
jgi:hypothetical protein